MGKFILIVDTLHINKNYNISSLGKLDEAQPTRMEISLQRCDDGFTCKQYTLRSLIIYRLLMSLIKEVSGNLLQIMGNHE